MTGVFTWQVVPMTSVENVRCSRFGEFDVARQHLALPQRYAYRRVFTRKRRCDVTPGFHSLGGVGGGVPLFLAGTAHRRIGRHCLSSAVTSPSQPACVSVCVCVQDPASRLVFLTAVFTGRRKTHTPTHTHTHTHTQTVKERQTRRY